MKWTRTLKWGASGKDVDAVHLWLQEVFDYWGDKYPVPRGGLFSFSTKKAVEHYQRRVYIPITGQVDEYTWDMLEYSITSYNNYYGQAYK